MLRVTRTYRMRLTPYYASLIQSGVTNDPILLQSVPTGEMVENVGIEIPPVAADHSPARLIDQFYPRTLTIKATNMCAMYCTHCLRIAHIGKRDRIYGQQHRWHAIQIYNDLGREGLWLGETLLIPRLGQSGAHTAAARPPTPPWMNTCVGNVSAGSCLSASSTITV